MYSMKKLYYNPQGLTLLIASLATFLMSGCVTESEGERGKDLGVRHYPGIGGMQTPILMINVT